MAISVESTSTRILVTISNDARGPFILQRAFYKDRTWATWTENGFVVIPANNEELEESITPLYINQGDFIDSFNLVDGLYEYRYIPSETGLTESGDDYTYSEFVKFGLPDAVGYSFNNYTVAPGTWGTAVTPDDCRYTYLWGTDFKATNGQYFSDEQIQYFIDESVSYLERELNITIRKRIIKAQAKDRELVKGTDYDDEESYYDFSFRKIQRYGMIQTRQRPIIDVSRCNLVYKGGDERSLLGKVVIDRKKGIIKFLERPLRPSRTYTGIADSLGMYGQETFEPHLFYAIDYTAGYETSDEIPKDLRQMIGKVAAISLLNVIGDGLMSGFSSSSLSMDGISESFSSTQSATSAYFGARIAVYQKEVENYITQNKYKFGYMPIGAL